MTEAEALRAIKEAFFKGRYFLDPHAHRRMKTRGISFLDIKHAAMNATKTEPYSDVERPLASGASAWRVHGTDFDGEALVLGVDLNLDHLGAFALVLTVF